MKILQYSVQSILLDTGPVWYGSGSASSFFERAGEALPNTLEGEATFW